jgi:hypothetical protein
MQKHPRTGRNFIKKGQLHSETALLKRQQEWLKKWKGLLQVSSTAMDEIGNSIDSYRRASLNKYSCR